MLINPFKEVRKLKRHLQRRKHLLILRRIIPSSIAASIVGVQPMTGPVGSVFSLKSRYKQMYIEDIKINIKEYRARVREYRTSHSFLREGQSLFNVLWDMNRVLGDAISRTELNPYYKEDKASIRKFWKWLEQHSDAR